MKTPTEAQKGYLAEMRDKGIDCFIEKPSNIELYFYLRSMPARRYSLNNTFILLNQLTSDTTRAYKIDPRSLQILSKDDWKEECAYVPEEVKPMLVWAEADGFYGIEEVFTNRDIVIPPDVHEFIPNTLETVPIQFEQMFSAILYALRYGNLEWSDNTGKHAELPGFFSNIIIERNVLGRNGIEVDDNKRSITIYVSSGNGREDERQHYAAKLLYELIEAYLQRLLPKESFQKSNEMQLYNEIIELAAFYSVISKGCNFKMSITNENAFINKKDKLLVRLQAVESLKLTIDSVIEYYKKIRSDGISSVTGGAADV